MYINVRVEMFVNLNRIHVYVYPKLRVLGFVVMVGISVVIWVEIYGVFTVLCYE